MKSFTMKHVYKISPQLKISSNKMEINKGKLISSKDINWIKSGFRRENYNMTVGNIEQYPSSSLKILQRPDSGCLSDQAWIIQFQRNFLPLPSFISHCTLPFSTTALSLCSFRGSISCQEKVALATFEKKSLELIKVYRLFFLPMASKKSID